MILHLAFQRVRRFEDFQGRTGIARSMLTDRLRRLEAAGVLARHRYQDRPPREEYRLTAMGADLFGTAMMITRWEKRWFLDLEIPAHRLRHKCGELCTPELRCRTCNAEVDVRDVGAEPGPGAGWDAPQPPRAQRRSTVDRGTLTANQKMLERAIEVLGDRWTAHTIAAAFTGLKRFNPLQDSLRVAPNILSERLARLVALGVLERRRYQQRPERFEYVLTPLGRDLFPIILELVRWGDDWLAGDAGPPEVHRHRPCGALLETKISCDRCGAEITPDSTGLA